MTETSLVHLNPAVDRAAAAERFARDGRMQIRDVLTEDSAQAIHEALRNAAWGLAWKGASGGVQTLRREQIAGLSPAHHAGIRESLMQGMRGREFGFLYATYPLITAYREKWDPGGPLHRLILEINAPLFLDFMREVTGIAELKNADGQATLYGANQFLSAHNDAEARPGRRVAYVLNLCALDWRPDWGGYLNFLDQNDDVIVGYRPRFNALNLFTVPQRHHVTYVPPYSPIGRFAITGWFRDR